MKLTTCLSAKVLLIGSFALPFLTSCSKDGNYDSLTESDGIDMTIEVGKNGLTLPLGSTSHVTLLELMNPDKAEELHIASNGDYLIAKSGTFNSSTISISQASLSMSPTVEPKIYQVDKSEFTQRGEELKQQIAKTYKDEYGFTEADRQRIYDEIMEGASFPYEMKADFSMLESDGFNLNTTVDAGLTAVRSVTPKTPITLNFSLNVKGLPSEVTILEFNPSIIFPDYMVVEGVTGHKVTWNDQLLHCANGAGTWTGSIVITAFDFENSELNTLPIKNGKFSLEDQKIIFDGSVASGLVTLKASSVATFDKVTITPSVEPITIDFAKVKGDFNKTDIDPIYESVEIVLDEDMDFIQSEDCHLDIENPVVKLQVSNGSELTVDAQIECIGASNVVFPQVQIEPGENTIYLSRLPIDDVKNCYRDDFATLLTYIPKLVGVKVVPTVNQSNVEVTLSDKQLSGNYDLSAPLKFNDVTICYDKVLDNVWGDDSEDITDKISEVKGAVLSMDAINGVPMDLTIEILAKDAAGNELNSTQFSAVVNRVITKGSLEEPQTTSIEAVITTNCVDKIEDLIVRIKGEGSGTFNSSQYLQLDNMKLTIKGQVVDLN